MVTIHERIKDERLKRGYTLLEVAERLGVREATVQRYESGEIKNIKYETITKLANIFNCSPAYLMGWDDKLEEKSNATEHSVLQKYNRLNSLGRCKVDAYIDGILENPDYIKNFDYNEVQVAAFGGASKKNIEQLVDEPEKIDN